MRNVRIFHSVIAVGGMLLQGGGAFGQGQVVGWGSSNSGVLSAGSSSLLRVTRLTAGQHGVLTLRADGTLAGWGATFSGAGAVPANLSGVSRMASGLFHTVVERADGSLVCFGVDGSNNFGQCNVPAALGLVVSMDAGSDHTLVAQVGGMVRCWGSDADGQCSVPSGVSRAVQVAAGDSHSMALDDSGHVTCWGLNEDGQCGVPALLTGVTRVEAGFYHSIAVKSDGSMACWGFNLDGQCNVPANLTRVAMAVGGMGHTVALRSSGEVIAWGDNAWGQSSVPAGLGTVRELAAGQWHTAALKTDGSVVCWGSNDYGQLTRPRTVADVTQVASGVTHAIAVTGSGAVEGWGASSAGESIPPPGLSGVVAVAAGEYHSMALRQDGTVVCWGFDGAGQVTVPASLASVSRIAAGTTHSMALKSNGRVVCWGMNGFGQCLGTNASGGGIYDTPTGQEFRVRGTVVTDAVDLDGGDRLSVLVRSNGSVTCVGLNDFGQTTVPASVSSVNRVAAGDWHVVVLRSNGNVTCWGRKDGGQCNVPSNLGSVQAIAAGGMHTVALRTDGVVRCWGSNANGQSLVPSDLGTATAIAAGSNQTFAILSTAASSCANPAGAGLATLVQSGAPWRDVAIWNWSPAARQVPGTLSTVDLGTYGSVGSDCSARASALTARPGTSLLVPADASAPGNDYSIRVGGTANLAGRLWLLGVTGAGTTLPENLNIPVLSAGTVNGNFDLIQSELPPPPGFFLTLVPESVGSRTVFSLRLLPLPGGAELAAGSTASFTGQAVAAATIDLNRDGFDDLALAIDFGASQPGRVQVLMNDGLGGLGSVSQLYTVSAQPTCLAVGDVDGDGLPDVVVGTASDSRVQVLRNTGSGALTVTLNLGPTNGAPKSVVVVPGGGSSLAAAGTVAVGTSGSKMQFFSSNGTLLQTLTLAGVPNAAGAGRLDPGRGKGIATGGTTSNSVEGLLPNPVGFVQTILPGAGGVFGISATMYVTAKPVALDVADLDGDNLDDIVTANAEPTLPAAGSALPVLSIFRNAAGTFGGGVPYQPTNASSGLSVSLIDVDTDGDRDIVSVYRRVGTDSEAALLRVDTLGPGTPISIGQTTVLDASDPILSARGNLDGAGGEDLFLVNQPSGSFLAGVREVKPFLASGGAKQGDLDGDGRVGASDIAILLLDFGPCSGCPSDLDGSGQVDSGDISFLLLLFD